MLHVPIRTGFIHLVLPTSVSTLHACRCTQSTTNNTSADVLAGHSIHHSSPLALSLLSQGYFR